MSVTDLGPKLPPHMRKTYGVHHKTREASCHEVIDGVQVCPAFWHGWRTALSPTEHPAQISYLDSGDSGRHFTKEATPDGLWVYTFTPGQRCFTSPHTVVDRQEEAQYLILAGDHRHYIGDRDENGNVKPVLVHSGASSFIDDFASHQEKLARAAE
jgi:hypothetical protein